MSKRDKYSKRRTKQPGTPTVNMTPSVQEIILDVVRKCGNVTEAARVANVSRTNIIRLEQNDRAFAKKMADAREHGIDVVESEVVRRAITGLDEPVFGKLPGKDTGSGIIGFQKVYSDRLLEILYRRHPDYRSERALTAEQEGHDKVTEKHVYLHLPENSQAKALPEPIKPEVIDQTAKVLSEEASR